MSADGAPVELVVFGGGNMGAALVEGILASGAVVPSSLAIVEPLDSRRAELSERFGGVLVTETAPPCAAAVIAVKPDVAEGATSAAVAAGARRVLSIAAGVTIERLQAAAGSMVTVVRAMPNTPALIGLGVTAIASSDEDALDWAESLLGSVGIVERLPERSIDAFTAVAGSGPAYVFYLAEALVDAAVDQGLPLSMAERVVARLLLGSSTLLDRRGDPEALRAQVTSPGGTTAAGIAALDEHGARAAFVAAVAAATERSRELGRT